MIDGDDDDTATFLMRALSTVCTLLKKASELRGSTSKLAQQEKSHVFCAGSDIRICRINPGLCILFMLSLP